jgi:hypothetical protein
MGHGAWGMGHGALFISLLSSFASLAPSRLIIAMPPELISFTQSVAEIIFYLGLIKNEQSRYEQFLDDGFISHGGGHSSSSIK